MNSWNEYLKHPVPLKLFVFHTGDIHMAGNIHFNKKSPAFKSEPRDDRFNPVLAFLVEHPEKGYGLFDTGLDASFAHSPRGNFGWLLGRAVKVRTSPGMDTASRLKALGVSPGDIAFVVLSHLHLDHPGGLPALPTGARPVVYADAEELKIARSFFGLFKGYIGKHLQGFTITPLSYSGPLSPFDNVCDLFGDGSIFVLRTPGHTPGHVSVLFNMKKGPLLLTFDAAHRRVNLDEGIPPKGEYAMALESLAKLRRFTEEHPSVRILFGHDPDQIERLTMPPDYYS